MGNHPEDRCQRCQGRNVVWFVPNDVWNTVDPKESILCPLCFVEVAEEKGIVTAWTLVPEFMPAARQK